MPPQSRGSPMPTGFQSKSTPNLPTLHSLDLTDLASTSTTKNDPQTAASTIPQSIPENQTPDLQPLSPTITTSPSEPASVEDNLPDDPSATFTFAASSSDEGSSTSGDDDDDSSRSPSKHPTTLYPPFYNRPPTPLPPSPSLTSLLRPTFSSTTSRPTTPESSDQEGHRPARGIGRHSANASIDSISTSAPNGHAGSASGTTTPGSGIPNLARASMAAAPVTPLASPRVPTYEYYGFALYLFSSLAFLMYILWAYLPSPFLHQLGIWYYPNRWWALAVPAWLVALIGYIYVALASYNLGYLTLPMTSSETLVDEAGNIAIVDKDGKIIRHDKQRSSRTPSAAASGNGTGGGGTSSTAKIQPPRHRSRSPAPGFDPEYSKTLDWKSLWSEGTDAVMDVPIGGVCEILYGDGRVREGWEIDGYDSQRDDLASRARANLPTKETNGILSVIGTPLSDEAG